MKKIKELLLNKSNLESEILLAHAISKDKVFILTHPEYELKTKEYCHFVYCLFLYNSGYSIASITHHKEFYGLDFFVNKNVLIPRPETELIVEEVLNEISAINNNTLLIDVGTGSACIPISILKNTSNIRQAIALDISNKALKVARKNIAKFNVNIELLKSNLLSTIIKRDYSFYEKIIITANLPYLTTDQVKQEPSIQKEPTIALIAKENGLTLYHQLLGQIVKIFSGKKLLILFEIDPSQTRQITSLAKNYLPQCKFEIKKDLAGLDRILKIST